MSLQTNQWLETAKALREPLEQYSQQAETEACVPKQAFEMVLNSGLFGLNIPACFGGIETDLTTLLDVTEELSYADSAIGWIHQIYAYTNFQALTLPLESMEKVFAGSRSTADFKHAILAGAAAPSGRAVEVDGGLLVNGRWAWGSGIQYADWVCANLMVMDGSEPKLNAKGKRIFALVWVPSEQVTLLDNWQTSGLRGSGSVDFQMNDIFVPHAMISQMEKGTYPLDCLYSKYPNFCVGSTCLSASPLGVARRALDDFDDIAQGKIPQFSSKTLSQNVIVHQSYGECESLYQSSRHHLHGSTNAMWDTIVNGGVPSPQEMRITRMAGAQVMKNCLDIIQKLYLLAGGSSLHLNCSLQKHWRDIHAASAHVLVRSDNFRVAGNTVLNRFAKP